jgi:CpeT/CpcT family (DUF1001)
MKTSPFKLFFAGIALFACATSQAPVGAPAEPSDAEMVDAEVAVDAAPSPDASGDPAQDAGADAATTLGLLAQLDGYLRGDFDNAAQVSKGFSKRVERHVCAIPGRPADDSERWLYVEQVELTPKGRDAYYTRVVSLKNEGSNVVSKIYKLAPGHPLASDAFAYNGPRDGCFSPEVLRAIQTSDLAYRTNCDITFQRTAKDRFSASTTGKSCAVPGGHIETSADVFEDGLDTRDIFVSGTMMLGDKFEFRRVKNFAKPDAGAPRDAQAD